jgi:glucose-1-phosphate thymidylyltransferase
VALVGVLPAAGRATRLQPLAGSKEVLPVAGRPVMDYVLERMRHAGCEEIRIVTRPDKIDVIAYAESRGAVVVLGEPRSVTESFAAGIRGTADDDIILIGWPDTLWEPLDGYVRLLAALEDGVDVALGLFQLDHDLDRSDVVTFERGRVTGIHVKPAEPPSSWVWGCAAARSGTLAGLEDEEWPGGFFDVLCRRGIPIAAVELSDRWLDIGTHEALIQAASWPQTSTG